MRKSLILLSFLMTSSHIFCQQSDSASHELPRVIVNAYEYNRRLMNIPAPVNHINRAMLERYSSASVVHAVNSTPGVRMEERSPGSYRFNIRGSSLRSPFGVRNVKVYFNDIPITDPGGHTYLNQLGYYNFNSISMIKGPGNSVYGAGTGGVLLISGISFSDSSHVFGEYALGSYGLQNIYGRIAAGPGSPRNMAGFQHQKSNGYRDHSALRRNVFTWNGDFRIRESIMQATILFGDLFYETPGALTREEFLNHPQAARPGAGGFPGAAESRASVHQKSFIAGISYRNRLSACWSSKTVLYGMFTELRNPTIRNYGHSSEPHFGGRSVFRYTRSFLSLDLGGEWQEGLASVSIHMNNGGEPDSLQSFDEINNRQRFFFAQATVDFLGWLITAGASSNFLQIATRRFNPAGGGLQKRNFNHMIAPRLAISRQLSRFMLYTSVSRGFSPPTTAELLPTGGDINLDLLAETSLNFDLGLRASLSTGMFADINIFYQSLSNMIVQRRDAGGGDYFINAGRTGQKGLESHFSLPFSLAGGSRISRGWLSHTWHIFRYREFVQLSSDFGGKNIPDIPEHILAAGIDFRAAPGVTAAFTWYYSSRMALNDSNQEYADAYHLLGARIAYEMLKSKRRWKLVAGAENLLDQLYSLGHDINGFGGRYYNAAPGRNFYASLIIEWRPNFLQK